MKAEEILKLVDAGFTKGEILKLVTDPFPGQEDNTPKDPAPEETPEEENSSEKKAEPEKKTSSDSSEEKEDEIESLRNELNSLKAQFFKKSRDEVREPATPREPQDLRSIFMSLDEEPSKEE